MGYPISSTLVPDGDAAAHFEHLAAPTVMNGLKATSDCKQTAGLMVLGSAGNSLPPQVSFLVDLLSSLNVGQLDRGGRGSFLSVLSVLLVGFSFAGVALETELLAPGARVSVVALCFRGAALSASQRHDKKK